MNLDNKAGAKHAPGVKCIVAVPDDVPAGVRKITEGIFSGMKIRSSKTLDNGSVVVIISSANSSSWRCQGCGQGWATNQDISHPVWYVKPIDGNPPLVSFYAMCDGKGVFRQEHLIPIGEDMTMLLNQEDLATAVEERTRQRKKIYEHARN